MSKPTIGFVVIYRWRLHPGKELQFQKAWERGTPLMITQRGGLGSRLHKADDGTWVAYAQWPDKAAWERARALDSVDPEVTKLMIEAEAEAFPPLLLTPTSDFLLFEQISVAS